MARTVLLPSLEGGAQLRGTAAMLRRLGREDLLRDVAKAVKDEADPTLKDLRQAARRIKIVGERTTAVHKFVKPTKAKHLRERIANAAAVEFHASGTEARISFQVHGSKMGGAHNIPAYIDNGERAGRGGWRHPLPNTRKRWAVSKGDPWFFAPIKDHLRPLRQHISVVLDEIVRKVEES